MTKSQIITMWCLIIAVALNSITGTINSAIVNNLTERVFQLEQYNTLRK